MAHRQKNKRATTPMQDVFGGLTGTIGGGMSKEEYQKKYPRTVSGFVKMLTSPYEDHVLDRKSIRTHSSAGRNNPRRARGAR